MSEQTSFFETMVLPILVPFAVCAMVLLVFLAFGRSWRRSGTASDGVATGAIGLGAGYLACHVLVDGLPAFPPHENWQWLIFLAASAMVIAFVQALGRWLALVRLIAAIFLAGAGGWLLVRTNQDHLWAHRATIAAAMLLWFVALEPIAGRARGASLSLPLCCALISVSFVLILSGNAKLAQLAAGFAASLGAATILAWRWPLLGLGRGMVIVAGVLLIGLLFSGYSLSFSTVPTWAYVVAAAAPLTTWIGALPPLRNIKPWQSTAIITATTIVVSGGAVVGAFLAWRAASMNDASYY